LFEGTCRSGLGDNEHCFSPPNTVLTTAGLVCNAALPTSTASNFEREMAMTEAILVDTPVCSDDPSAGLNLSETVRFRDIRATDFQILRSERAD
jgi:hypothetical protein